MRLQCTVAYVLRRYSYRHNVRPLFFLCELKADNSIGLVIIVVVIVYGTDS